jgi:type III pantothenate kinase
MNDSPKDLFALDLGNSTCRVGIFRGSRISDDAFVDTDRFIDNPQILLERTENGSSPLCYCSVCPPAEIELVKWAIASNKELFCLTNRTCLDFPIAYPCPEEIGPDRIANSFAVHRTSELPAIVIDVGTATTFDVINEEDGYLGGVIAPGPQGFLDFLHQNTALLPKVAYGSKAPESPIGKTTSDAMLLGARLGFGPMITGILNRLKKEVKESCGKAPLVILAGGAARHLDLENFEHRPFLTLEGIALAYLENTLTQVSS